MKGFSSSQPKVGVTSERPVFNRRTARLLTIVIFGTVTITQLYMLFAETRIEGARHGTNSYSVSAVGYQGLHEFLDRMGVPVLASRAMSGQRAGPTSPLVILESTTGYSSIEAFRRMVEQAETREAAVVVVLPKWWGKPAADREEWVEEVGLRPVFDARMVLGLCLDEEPAADSVLRPDPSDIGSWSVELPDVPAPRLSHPQLLAPGLAGVEPLISCAAGTLAATVHDRELLVISDPDLLNNLGLGDNSVIAYRLLVELHGATALVIDETLHGFTGAPSFWRELLEFPLLLVSLQLVVVFAAVLWVGSDRFGTPRPAPPRYPPGKLTLIDNTTRLIARGGHLSRSLDEYLRLTLRRSARELGLQDVSSDERLPRLEQLSGARRSAIDLGRLARWVRSLQMGRCDPKRALWVARRLHRWREEILDAKLSRG
jgi:hypothetical protein